VGWKAKEKTDAVSGERSGEVAEKPFLQGQGDLQAGGNQAVQPSFKGGEWSSVQRHGVASVHFKLLPLEPSAELLLRKRLKVTEGQVGHGPPPALHSFKSAKYLPGSPSK